MCTTHSIEFSGRHPDATVARMRRRRRLARGLASAAVVGAVAGTLVWAESCGSTSRRSAVKAASVCSVTVSAGMSAAAIVWAVVGAADGGVVCLAGGSYPALTVIGAAHSGYVTVRGAPGATPTVAGMRIANSSFLRVEGLRFSEGVNAADGVGGASHDLQFVDNTFEDASYGIVVNGNGAPITRVLIEGNYFHHLDFPGTCSSGAGYAGGQGVTNYYGDGITVAHNTFKEVGLQ